MKYFDELTRVMADLASYKDTIYLGQACKFSGHALYKTLRYVPIAKRIEMPVAEELQMGISNGLALNGFVPISIYPRWDFLLLAANQLINHLDKFKEMSNGKYDPKIIIRVAVGATEPLYPGVQHCQDHTDAFEKLMTIIKVIKLKEPEQIHKEYMKAYQRNQSTLLVEYMNFYNEK